MFLLEASLVLLSQRLRVGVEVAVYFLCGTEVDRRVHGAFKGLVGLAGPSRVRLPVRVEFEDLRCR